MPRPQVGLSELDPLPPFSPDTGTAYYYNGDEGVDQTADVLIAFMGELKAGRTSYGAFVPSNRNTYTANGNRQPYFVA